jgi:hypothetical protein
MDAIEFIVKYPEYLQEIRDVVKPELFPLVDELEKIDPHDLLTPASWFPNESSARGYVWSMFLKQAGIVHSHEAVKY